MNKKEKALMRIKAVVDSYVDGKIHITSGNHDFNVKTHTYDVSVIMGIIGTYVVSALNDKR